MASIVARGLDESVEKQHVAQTKVLDTNVISEDFPRASGARHRVEEGLADVVVSRGQAGLPIHSADAQITAICPVDRTTCATRNGRDFTGTGVELVDPGVA